MSRRFQNILDRLPEFKAASERIQEALLANLVLVGEIPAPTFEEEKRIAFLKDRFGECGLHNVSTDEAGNGFGIRPGLANEKAILVVAHADTPYAGNLDHTITVQPDYAEGVGVADNSFGLAVLATLPTLLDELDIQLNSDLVLMAASKSLGRGNLSGLSFFLSNNHMPIRAGVCVEGIQLGRLSIESIGMIRAAITCRVPEEYDWTRFGAAGAITTINEVLNKIIAIELPQKPRTSIVLGSISGGRSFNIVARDALVQFEIRSESAEMVKRIAGQIKDLVAEVSSQTESEVCLDVVASREPGGIPFAHPLSRRTRKIMDTLGWSHRMTPSTSELSAFIDRAIPAVTVGMTTGERVTEEKERLQIEPMSSGLAQLMGMLMAIDGGFCDGRK